MRTHALGPWEQISFIATVTSHFFMCVKLELTFLSTEDGRSLQSTPDPGSAGGGSAVPVCPAE